jgi:hypothetical protein
MTNYKKFLFDIKPLPLRDGPEWTTHFVIYRDTRDGIEVVRKVEVGNRCKTETEAQDSGLLEAKCIVDAL